MAKKSSKKSLGDIYDNWDVMVTSTELIPERLYFVVLRTPYKPYYTQNVHFFTIDDELKYDPFLEDFGPLNLALLYHYCFKLNMKLKTPSLLNKKIVHYTTLKPKKRVNAAFLAGAYAIIYLNMLPNEIYKRLNKKEAPPFRGFRDASNGCALYEISLLDCLNAVYQAHINNFFNFDDFNVCEYEFYETVQNGDLNWIVPNKFLAFAGPQSKNYLNFKGRVMDPLIRTPDSYVAYFRENNVKTIIRLNNKLYDSSEFTKEGFTHIDLFFIDGSTPSDGLLEKFLIACESTDGAVAVHCKAGLGRTGSMIACYIMKWYRFSAREAIAWLRICRPASIIGHQQEWLEMKQNELWLLNSTLSKPKHNYGIYSFKSKIVMKPIGYGKGALKPVKESRPLPVDNVSRIASKVDSMSIDSNKKDENKNENIVLNNRMCSKMIGKINFTSPNNQLKGEKKNKIRNTDILFQKDSPNDENYNFVRFPMEQGDVLNEIKVKRLSRGYALKSGRKTCCPNTTNSIRKVIVADKSNMITHAKRPLTRSKSSQSPAIKGISNESNRTLTLGPASSVRINPPAALSTPRSSTRLHSYSLRHSRLSDPRIYKAASVR